MMLNDNAAWKDNSETSLNNYNQIKTSSARDAVAIWSIKYWHFHRPNQENPLRVEAEANHFPSGPIKRELLASRVTAFWTGRLRTRSSWFTRVAQIFPRSSIDESVHITLACPFFKQWKAVKITKWFLSAFPLSYFSIELFFCVAGCGAFKKGREIDTHETLSSPWCARAPTYMMDAFQHQNQIFDHGMGKRENASIKELRVVEVFLGMKSAEQAN